MKTIDCLKFPIDGLVSGQKGQSNTGKFCLINGLPPPVESSKRADLVDNQEFKKQTIPRPSPAGIRDAFNERMMHKVSLLPAMVLLLAAAVAAKVRALIDEQAPMGYQDETGFHCGVKTAGDSTWTSLW